ncbi:MAG: flavin reductase [Lachnospiraceae bacterium]|jgi:flavin reductase (DIM6/NTAB) family NADH-FMN oxidoreductase RutF/ribonuclease HI|nr:flavin reductase [Lachnospiraceae bacterium]
MSKETWKPGNMLYPLPVVCVSCKRPGEKPNIITIAWAGTICSNPPMVSISITKQRYSHDIIWETKEFVINLVNKDLIYPCDYCGVKSGRDVDKFKEMNLTPLKSKNIEAPGIKESPVNIECKVKQIIELGSHDMFIAEVVGVTVENEYMDENNKFSLNETGLVTYSHGEYFTLGEKIGKFGYSVRKNKGKLVAYVDGSYNVATKEFSYGMVLIGDLGTEQFSKKFNDESLSSMRNVAGEIKGAEAAISYAYDNGYKELEIYYDYEGIAKWPLSQWKANKEGTKAYKAYYDKLKDKIKIKFNKVIAHTGDKYNEMADKLAKDELGIK